MMNIGRAAEASGVSTEMIRHYETFRLLPAVGRTVAGYRIYHDVGIHRFRFIRRASDLGFSMNEPGALVGLWRKRGRARDNVTRLAARNLRQLEEKIREFQSMRDTLAHRVEHCHGDERPDCPVLDDPASDQSAHCSDTRKSSSRVLGAH